MLNMIPDKMISENYELKEKFLAADFVKAVNWFLLTIYQFLKY